MGQPGLAHLIDPNHLSSHDNSDFPIANAKLDDVSDLLGEALFLPLYKWMMENGPVYRLAAGLRNFVVMSDPAVTSKVASESEGLSCFVHGEIFCMTYILLFCFYTATKGEKHAFANKTHLKVSVQLINV
ncbi:Carotene epsilon-monooxygenase [Carex littledalei]|uniref:Carotene epsilon-monooxygenase n=1 Tax=Carex littledalei TaxID=544730 RepID=A0A833VE72_9POAL|nr:Carotene epsilon-monooxygenase [Carex littledalei]